MADDEFEQIKCEGRRAPLAARKSAETGIQSTWLEQFGWQRTTR
jgi:hypothetical protein